MDLNLAYAAFPPLLTSLVVLLLARQEKLSGLSRVPEIVGVVVAWGLSLLLPVAGYLLAGLASWLLLVRMRRWCNQPILLSLALIVYLANCTILGVASGVFMFAVGEVYRSHPYQPIVRDPVPWPQDFPALIVRVRDTGHLGRTGTALWVARPAELPAVQTSLMWLCRRFHQLDQLQEIDIYLQNSDLLFQQVRGNHLSDIDGNYVPLGDNWCGKRRTAVSF